MASESLKKIAPFIVIVLLLLLAGSTQASPPVPTTRPSPIDPSVGWTIETALSGNLITSIDVSPDGSEVAYTVQQARFGQGRNEWTSEIRIAGSDGAGLRQIGAGLDGAKLDAAKLDGARSPRWSPDGSIIALLAPMAAGELAGTQQLFLIETTGGEPRPQTAMPAGVSSHRWSPQGDRLAFTTYDLPQSANNEGTAGAIVAGADTLGMSLWVIDARAQGGDVAVAVARRCRGGRNAHLPVRLHGRGAVPLILTIHGGPAGMFSGFYFGWQDIYPYATWAEMGYAVLRVNPRGSIGYGATFRKANIEDWNDGPYSDLMTGVDEVIALGVADPERLAVAGWSYGGYMTAEVTTRTDRFRAAIVGAGPVNLISQTGTCDLPTMIPAYMGGNVWERPDTYVSQSPIFAADKVQTPTLILHGLDDTRVPFSQGQEWYTAVRAQGVESELVGFPRSGHVVQEPVLMYELQQRAISWVDTHLR